MQFTKAEDYGLHGIMYLAEQPNGKVTPLSEISEAQQVPEKFLAKIFQSLSKTGLVKSHRGVKGGFSMARSADKIEGAMTYFMMGSTSRLIETATGGGVGQSATRKSNKFCTLGPHRVHSGHTHTTDQAAPIGV